MKLAELLIEKKDLQEKLRQLGIQMQNNVKIQEGDESAEEPAHVLVAYQRTNSKLETVTTKINMMNNQTIIADLAISLTEAIEKREAIGREYRFIDQTIEHAQTRTHHYFHSEIKSIVTIDLKAYHALRDELAKKMSKLDIAIQETNWQTEIN